VDDRHDRVTLDGNPTFEGGSSAWSIPAGVGGTFPAAQNFLYDLGPGGAQGFDHFDGVLFIVYGNHIREAFKWSSYTSRRLPTDPQHLSSIRGNKSYFFTSFKSSNARRNFSLAVTDVITTNWGTSPPEYDGVGQARFYFPPIRNDSVPPGGDPVHNSPLGKTAIRFHHSAGSGGGASWSAGCSVSPVYSAMRFELIKIYREELNLLGMPADPDVERLCANSCTRGLTQAESEALYNLGNAGLPRSGWDNKIAGVLWLIRPDEVPLP
jgi:hypothetical protein